MVENPFIAYWYFHLPNYALAILMYMMLGRLVLSFFFRPESESVIWRAFVRITDPVVWLVQAVTPRIAPMPIVLVFATIWLLLARFVFLSILLNMGAAPAAS